MEIIRLTDENFKSTVKRASQVLKQGGIILYPTDTLYGLGVDAFNLPALEQLREMKGREKKKPFSVIVPDVAALEAYAELSPESRSYVERFLPGALTLVLPANPRMPQELLLNGDIGIRIPNEPFALALASAYGRPFTATSANRSTLPTLSTPHEILLQFRNLAEDIALVIDDGERKGARPSTVLTFRDGKPYVLREGALTRAELGLS